MATRKILPLLCECQRMDEYLEHRDMDSSYVVRVMHRDKSHVVLLHRRWLDAIVYTDGRTFAQLMQEKPPDECCRMVSRILLGALRFRPDYVVVVADDGAGAPQYSGLTMETVAQGVQSLLLAVHMAEGPDGTCNFLGRRLTELCGVLADRGFFDEGRSPRNVLMAVK